MSELATFVCSICSEPSLAICVFCTKDACPNHRCDRCHRCSDCCECEVPLTAPEVAVNGHFHAMGPSSLPQPDLAEPAKAEAPEVELESGPPAEPD